MSTFDATDKKFQQSEKFLPDKEGTWKYPMDRDGWMHAHNAIRRQLRLAVETYEAMKQRGSSLEQWEIDCITQVWKHQAEIIKDHHTNEDEVFTPFLKTRFKYPEKCETDHDDLVVLLDKLSALVKSLKPGDSVDALLSSYVELEEHMLPHLKEEEDVCLPLSRAYFTPEELGPKVKEAIDRETKVSMGAFIHTMGEERFRKEFMKQEGIPFFVWYIVFMWQVRAYKHEVITPIEKLKAGSK